MIINIKFDGGSGLYESTAAVNLSELLPCSTAAFKKFIKLFLECSQEPEATALIISGYISDNVKKLQQDITTEKNKKRAADLNAAIVKYIACNDILVKLYGVQKITDINPDNEIKMKKSDVFALRYDSATRGQVVKSFSGWKFEKCGYTFDIYKDNKDYCILLHGTGLKVATAYKKADCIAAISPDLVQIINKDPGKIRKYTNNFYNLMSAAGYKNYIDFSADPAPEAAETNAAESAPKTTIIDNSANDSTEIQPDTKKPEKAFIGTTISGPGYKIYFDPDLQRTRIIYEIKPTAAAIAAIQAAGFYWSSVQKSYNKKLTFKAYRAALALNNTLLALG